MSGKSIARGELPGSSALSLAESDIFIKEGEAGSLGYTAVGQEREHWKGRIDFLLASIGFHVGLGNVWRFPYLCYLHGGSAFLLPYIIMTLVAGLPLSFLEYSVGQFTSQGPVTCWGMVPLLSGIGWSSVLISAMVCVYYNVIIMYALLYIFLSLTNIGWAVPWATCQNRWNDKTQCLDTSLPDLDSFASVSDKIMHSLSMKNESCVHLVSEKLGIGDSRADIEDAFVNDFSSFEDHYSSCNIKFSLPAQQYWNNFILELSDEEHIGSIGSLIGRNAIFLFIAWVVVFVCILRGPRSIAKVVYFTATYPLGILVIFLIRGLSRQGSNAGIEYYVVPKWDGLLDPGTWGAAGAQALYSLGMVWGGNITLASYNKFHHKVFRDSMVISLINAGVSIFAGFVTFALIGSVAHETNTPVRDLVESGPELVFVIYPQGLSTLPSPAIWSFLYFLMVFTLGLDSQFGMMETIAVSVTDRFPDTVGKHRTKFVLVCCVIGFLLGLPLTTKGGIYILNFLNFYAASYAVMILALVELIMIAWIYGVKNFFSDLEQMLGKKHWIFWLYCGAMWTAITPIVIVMMFVMSMMSYKPPVYESKVIPAWAETIGWLMVFGPILCVVGRALKMLFYKKIPVGKPSETDSIKSKISSKTSRGKRTAQKDTIIDPTSDSQLLQALKPSKSYGPRHEQDNHDLQEISISTDQIGAETEYQETVAMKTDKETPDNTESYLNPIYVRSENDTVLEPNTNSFLNGETVGAHVTNGDNTVSRPTPCLPSLDMGLGCVNAIAPSSF